MKKAGCLLAALVLLLGCAVPVAAEEATVTVTVSIADTTGTVLAGEEVTVTDADGDGAFTIHDALYAAHEAAYTGGAAAGYETSVTQWGLGITKLWGDASGSYGYYVNSASAFGLADPIEDGDYIDAFVYAQADWSDVYCYFDQRTVALEEGESVTLTLKQAGYDANWNPITLPVEGAVITVDGADTAFVTDANGAVTVELEAGEHVISAKSATLALVPPVCVATVEQVQQQPQQPPVELPATGDTTAVWAAITLMIACGAIVWSVKRGYAN